jgi:hypothetical protein
MRFILATMALLALSPGFAATPATCPADLAKVDDSFAETQTRLDAAGEADDAEKCAAIRHHIDVMSAAREVFMRCLTGHDFGENVGQIDGTIDDFRILLRERKCPEPSKASP